MANVYATIQSSGVLEQSNCFTSGVKRQYATLTSAGILEQPSCLVGLLQNILTAFTQPITATDEGTQDMSIIMTASNNITAVMEKDESFVVTRKMRRRNT